MKVFSLHRRPPVWLALLAMLWQLLLPWSQAMAHDAAAGERVPVCTATGLKWIALDVGAPAETGSTSDGTHCALCVFGEVHPVLHDVRTPLVIPPAFESAPRATDAPSPRLASPYTKPPSRAPPLLHV